MPNSNLVSITAEYADGRKLVHDLYDGTTNVEIRYDVFPPDGWNRRGWRVTLDDPSCWRELPAPAVCTCIGQFGRIPTCAKHGDKAQGECTHLSQSMDGHCFRCGKRVHDAQ